MKILTLASLLTLSILPLSTYACPPLAGEYWCVINDGHREPWLDVLTIRQWVTPEAPSVTNFSSEYRSIPGGTDTFRADDQGIPDSWGWITKCTKDRVISVRSDYSAISELYLDPVGNFIRAENQRVAQECSPKSRGHGTF